jgi:hypothetical protein
MKKGHCKHIYLELYVDVLKSAIKQPADVRYRSRSASRPLVAPNADEMECRIVGHEKDWRLGRGL